MGWFQRRAVRLRRIKLRFPNVTSPSLMQASVLALQRGSICRSRLPICRRTPLTPQALLKASPGSDAVWSQDTDEVTVTLAVKKDVTKKRVNFEVHPKRLELRIDDEPRLWGSLEDAGEVDIDGCYWYIDDKGSEETKVLTVVLLKRVMGHESFPHLFESDIFDTTITSRIYLSVDIDGKVAGVMIVGMFGRAAPSAVQNFETLTNGRGPYNQREELTEAVFKHITPGKYAEFGLPGPSQGSGAYLRDPMKFEKKGLKHDSMGLLSVDTEGTLTDFTLTFNALTQFDNKRTVFGKLLNGMDLLARIEAEGDEATGKPKSKIVIRGCGAVNESEAELIMKEEAQRRIFAKD